MPEVIDILSDDDDDVSTDSTPKANAADAREGTWKIVLLMDHREVSNRRAQERQ